MAAGDNKENPAVENGNFLESRHSIGVQRRFESHNESFEGKGSQ